ncbi:carbohydrate ABC transporter permease [Melioribacteraceae bacterium 4301-Me]|uniref:carbohydrate ABC transporter permease n=1 Tax=Pyranulibacter aquaticus TaxID=3163344 RepID=UPI0035975E53
MKESAWIKLLKFSGAIFLLIFCLSPFIWMLIISFSTRPDFLSARIQFIPTINNYAQIIFNKSFHLFDYLKNSVVVSLLSAFLAMFFASLSAYAITRLNFPGRIFIPLLLLSVSMFPQISIVGYLFKLLTFLGWINTYYSLIFPYLTLGLPLAFWIMLSYFSQLPIELDNAALIDGATRFQILRKIILPVSLPGLLSTFILIFIYSFNEFLLALMFTIDYKARTIPVGIAMFEGFYGQVPWGYIMAASVISIIPMIILIAFFQKYIVRGLTEGTVKE